MLAAGQKPTAEHLVGMAFEVCQFLAHGVRRMLLPTQVNRRPLSRSTRNPAKPSPDTLTLRVSLPVAMSTAQRAIRQRGDRHLAFRLNADGKGVGRIAAETASFFAGRRVPKSNGFVIARRQDTPAVGGKSDRPDPLTVTGKLGKLQMSERRSCSPVACPLRFWVRIRSLLRHVDRDVTERHAGPRFIPCRVPELFLQIATRKTRNSLRILQAEIWRWARADYTAKYRRPHSKAEIPPNCNVRELDPRWRPFTSYSRRPECANSGHSSSGPKANGLISLQL